MYIPPGWNIAKCHRALSFLDRADFAPMSTLANQLGIGRQSYENLGPESMAKMLARHIEGMMTHLNREVL